MARNQKEMNARQVLLQSQDAKERRHALTEFENEVRRRVQREMVPRADARAEQELYSICPKCMEFR